MTTAAQAPTFPAEVVRWREEFESFHNSRPRSVDQHTGHKDQAIVFDG